jgi:hypothetical protein
VSCSTMERDGHCCARRVPTWTYGPVLLGELRPSRTAEAVQPC